VLNSTYNEEKTTCKSKDVTYTSDLFDMRKLQSDVVTLKEMLKEEKLKNIKLQAQINKDRLKMEVEMSPDFILKQSQVLFESERNELQHQF